MSAGPLAMHTMASELGWQGWLTIATVFVTIVLLMAERFRPDRVMGGAALVLVVSGVLEPLDALSGFWNAGVLTIALLSVLVAALKTTGAIRWIADWLLGPSSGEFRAQARLVGIAAPLSAFINNTPIVAMMTSAVEHWTRRSGVAPSKLLMPMNYASILGGMCTLLGTSTNLIVAGLVLQTGVLPELHMFSPLSVGAIAAVVGVVYLLTLGRLLLPERRSAIQQAADPRQYTVEMLVEAGVAVDGKTIQEAQLRHLAGSYLVELIRGDTVFPAIGPDTRLQAGDRLVFVGQTDAVRELRRVPGLRPATDQLFKIEAVDGQRTLAEAVLSPFSPSVGKTLMQSGFRTRYNAAVIALSRAGERLHQKPGDVVLQAGDTLLVETDAGFLARHGSSPDFLMVNAIDADARVDRPRALAALAILCLMVLGNTLLGLDILLSALAAALLVIVAGCVSLAELRRSLDLRLIVLIAFSFALGAALDTSGVAVLIASNLGAWASADPFWTLVLVYTATVLATEMLTNNAAAVLMFPIAMAAAVQVDANPMPFVIAVMMGASAGFMSPIGYQTNLMIYGPGGYRFTDYLRVGAPLSLVVGIALLWSIPRFWPF